MSWRIWRGRRSRREGRVSSLFSLSSRRFRFPPSPKSIADSRSPFYLTRRTSGPDLEPLRKGPLSPLLPFPPRHVELNKLTSLPLSRSLLSSQVNTHLAKRVKLFLDVGSEIKAHKEELGQVRLSLSFSPFLFLFTFKIERADRSCSLLDATGSSEPRGWTSTEERCWSLVGSSLIFES